MNTKAPKHEHDFTSYSKHMLYCALSTVLNFQPLHASCWTDSRVGHMCRVEHMQASLPLTVCACGVLAEGDHDVGPDAGAVQGSHAGATRGGRRGSHGHLTFCCGPVVSLCT